MGTDTRVISVDPPEFPPMYPAQSRAICGPERIAVIEAATKAGKTLGCLLWMLTRVWNNGFQGRNSWWVAPIYASAESLGYRRMCGMLTQMDPLRRIWKSNDSKLFIELANGGRIWFKGAEKPDSLYGEDVHECVVDEATRCFVAGTPVDTPFGPRPIESIVAGQAVLNAAGVGVVRRSIQKTGTAITVVTVQGYTLVSSIDHRYFTQRGWVEARYLGTDDTLIDQAAAVRLVRGDVQASPAEAEPALLQSALPVQSEEGRDGDTRLCAVWSGIHGQSWPTADTAFLRSALLSEMENDTAGRSCEGLQPGRGRKSSQRPEEVLVEGHSADTPHAKTHGNHECNARSCGPCEGIGDAQADRAPAAASRERVRVDGASVESVGGTRPGFRRGVHDSNSRRENSWRAASEVHRRPCKPDRKDCRRGGRSIASVAIAKGIRSAAGSLPLGARVESVAVYESGSAGFARLSGGADSITLYDLVVSGHPSFSVRGHLVHNCKDAAWHAIRSTLTATRGLLRIIGNVKGRKNWVYKLGRSGDPDVKLHKITAYDAAEAGVVDVAEIEAAKRQLPYDVWLELYMAQAADAGGGCFHAFDYQYNVRPCKYDPARAIVIGSDFNISPMCWCIGHRWDRTNDSPERLEWFDELVIDNCHTQKALDVLWSRYAHHRSGFEFYGDASGRNRHTSATLTDYQIIHNDTRFIRAGRTIHYLNSNPPRKDRFDSCNAMFCTADGRRRMFVDPGLTNLIRDLEYRQYKEGTFEPDPDERKQKIGHISDAMGYVVYKLFALRAIQIKQKAPVMFFPGG